MQVQFVYVFCDLLGIFVEISLAQVMIQESREQLLLDMHGFREHLMHFKNQIYYESCYILNFKAKCLW